MAYMNLVLILAVPPHHCQLPGKPENISIEDWQAKFIPLTSDEMGLSKLDSCSLYEDIGHPETNRTQECTTYDYDKTWYESTVATDNDWVCNNEIYVANAFSYTKIAELIGAVVFGWFGDKCGRRWSYITSLAFIIFGRLISMSAPKYFPVFMFGCAIAAFPSWSVIQSITVVSLEVSSPRRRTISNATRSIAATLGVCIMPLLYWWLRDWRYFAVATTVPLIPFLLMSWKFIESPRWLWIEGKSKSCIKVLKHIAKVNGNKLTIDSEMEILVTNPQQDKDLGFIAIFSNKHLIYKAFLLQLLWIGLTICYTVQILSIGREGNENPFLEFTWQSAAEFPANLMAAWLCDKIGRRHTTSLGFGVSSMAWMLHLLQSYKNKYVWLQSLWIRLFLFAINRFAITGGYYSLSLLNMEIYPTCLRQTGMSFGNVSSSAASAVAPYILLLGHHIHKNLTDIVLIALCLSGVVVTYLLPETLNMKLPETLNDAKFLKKPDQHFNSVSNSEERESISLTLTELKTSGS